MLNQTVMHLSAFSGLGMESMTRGPGWRFLDMGRRIERAVHTMRAVANTLSHVTRLFAAPAAGSSARNCRQLDDLSPRYQGSVQLAAVLDLLLADEANPRSARISTGRVAEHVNICREKSVDSLRRESPERLMQATLTAVRSDRRRTARRVRGGFRRTELETLSWLGHGRAVAPFPRVHHAHVFESPEASRHLGLISSRSHRVHTQ